MSEDLAPILTESVVQRLIEDIKQLRGRLDRVDTILYDQGLSVVKPETDCERFRRHQHAEELERTVGSERL